MVTLPERPDRPAPTTRLACVSVERPELLLPSCRRLTPRIERHPQMLVLDLTGCDDLLALLTHETRPQHDAASWLALAQQLSQFLTAGDSPCRTHIGLAPTRTLAWLAALRASTTPPSSPHLLWQAVAPEDALAFLQSLPLTALLTLPELAAEHRAAQEALTALAHGGVKTIGRLQRLSGESLRRRFGPLGDILLALATGQDLTPLRPERPSSWLGARLHLAPPATAEQLTPSLRHLAETLTLHLSRRHQAGCSLELTLRVDGGGILTLRHALARPISAAPALAEYALRLLQTLLQPRRAAHGACERYTRLQLRIGDLRAVAPDQAYFWTQPPQQERTVRLQRLRVTLAPLALRYHAPPLLRAQCVAPHAVLPEARYALVDWTDWTAHNATAEATS